MELMSILVKFGIWAVPLGVVLAFLPLLYQTEFESTELYYVQETCNRTLGSYKLQCPNISSDLKELFKSHGVVVLRQVLPPELIEDLIGEVQCRFRPKEKSRSWALFARNVWMDSEVPGYFLDGTEDYNRFFYHIPQVTVENWGVSGCFSMELVLLLGSQVFGRFALHQDSPLGCLAAQLIPGAHTIRYGHEELNMLVEEQNGTEAWQTDLESNLPENLTGSVPLVRFFLPLIRQNLRNVTGGSESVFPLNHFARLRKYYPPCFDEDGRLKGTCLAMNNLAAAPALAPGDLLLYSPLMPHRTQRMLSGSRIGLSGSLYEPSLLIPWVAEVKSLELLTEPPDMGLVCWDKNTKEWHGNLNWQSAGTHGISNGTTACFPQVYPQPQDGNHWECAGSPLFSLQT